MVKLGEFCQMMHKAWHVIFWVTLMAISAFFFLIWRIGHSKKTVFFFTFLVFLTFSLIFMYVQFLSLYISCSTWGVEEQKVSFLVAQYTWFWQLSHLDLEEKANICELWQFGLRNKSHRNAQNSFHRKDFSLTNKA